MDYTKEHKRKVNSLLMERWGYGKKGEAIEEVEELDEMQGHPGKCCDTAHPDEEHEDYMGRTTIRLGEALPDVSPVSGIAGEEEIDVSTASGMSGEEDMPEEEIVSTDLGKGTKSGSEFRKSQFAKGKEGETSGFTNRERSLVDKVSQMYMTAAKEKGINIASGDILQLTKKIAKLLKDKIS